MYSDLRSALRHLVKSPGFSAVAIITLALALGVNSAIFSLVNGLLLKPTMAREPEHVVSVFTAQQASNRDFRQFSHQEFIALRESNEPFSEVAAMSFALAGIGEGDAMRRALTFFVSDNFFSFSGTQPALGRFFTAEESRPNADIPVVVASHNLWQRMGRRADFVGSTLRVNGRPHTVIGVAPDGFAGISIIISPDIWMPLGMYGIVANPFGDNGAITDLANPLNYTLTLRARLAPGFTLESARTRLPVVADARLNALLPPEGKQRALQITPPTRLGVSTSPDNDGPLAVMGTLLCAMAGIVLLIASLNLANLLLARGTARAREIAVRMAVGATRWQIVRQLTIEGLMLAVLGGIVGLMLSTWTNAILQSSHFQTLLTAFSFSLSTQFQPDLLVLAATFGFCVLATLVFSVGPAWRASRADLVQDLKAQSGEPAATGRFNRFFAGRHVLVMSQVALSLALVFSAGLFLRAALNAGGMNPGFRPAGVVVAAVDYSLINAPQPEGLRRILDVTEQIRVLPGVQSAGLTSLLPYGNMSTGTRVMPADAAATPRGPDDPLPGFTAVHSSITSGYLASLGVTLLRGRDFTDIESREKNSPPVAIVDESLARQLFPDDDALGRQIRYTEVPVDGSPKEMTIVGITSRHRHDLHDEAGGKPHLYVPLAQNYSAATFLLARLTSEDSRVMLATLPVFRQQLRAVDPEIPLLQLLPLRDLIEKNVSLWIVRIAAGMFGVFGGIALVLATVGVYGVKAYTVERRTREIGIRMALGADRASVFALIMRQGALQTLVASLAGIGLALLIGRALTAMLYDVNPSDPLTLLGATGLLALATIVACWVPARRATKVNPNKALRGE